MFKMVATADPKLTKAKVLIPALCFFIIRSHPIRLPNIVAINNRIPIATTLKPLR